MAHPLAGKPAPREMLVNVQRLLAAYFEKPDPKDPAQRVSFGTSGHRGSSLKHAFNEAHIAAVTQATCEFRKQQGTTGPLYLGIDTHALSGPARTTAIEVLAVKAARLRLGADPMGGANISYWDPIAAEYGLNIEVVNRKVDPTFSFMPLDHDGKIRMDCSSPYAMANLLALKDRFDLAFGNDTDSDRHGIVTPSGGLMNPNPYLA